MPSYLQQFKDKNPRVGQYYSDDEIIDFLPKYAPEEFGNLNPEQVRFKALDDRGTIRKGYDAGIDQLQAMGGGAAAIVGDVTGIDSVRDWGLDVYRRNMEEAALSAPETNFLDIDGVGDALNWAGYTLGNIVPAVATSVAGGGVGGLLANQAVKKTAASMLANLTSKGMATEMAKQEVGKFVAKRVALGAALGTMSASSGMSTGNLYGETEDAAVSAVHGLIAGSIDALPIMRIFGRFGVAREAKDALETSVIREIGTQGLAEASTEAVQTLVEQHAKYWAEAEAPRLFGNEIDWREVTEAAAAGALGGAAMGGGASVINRDPMFFRRQTPPKPEDDLNKAIGNANAAAAAVLNNGGDALSAELARATTEATELPAAVATARETARRLYSDPIAAPAAPITIPGQMPDFPTVQRPKSNQTIPGQWNQSAQPAETQRVIENSAIDPLISIARRAGDETSSVRLEAAKRMQALSERFAAEGNQQRATKMAGQALAIVEDVKAKLPANEVAPEASARSGELITVWTGRRGDGYLNEQFAESGLESRRKVRPDLDWRIEQMPSGKFQLAGYATERTPRERLTTPDMQAVDTLSQAQVEGESRRAGQPDPAIRQMQSAAIDRAMASIERRGGVATRAEADLLNEYGMGAPYDSIQQAPVIAPENVRMSSSGQPFKSEQQARSSVPYRQNPGATVIQSGEGYAVQLPEPLKSKSPEAARIERLEKVRSEYEQAYERGQLNESVASIDKADAEIVSFAKESIDRGESAMFKSKDGDMYYTVTPSAQETGKFQVTVYNDTGMLSDSQLNSLDDVSSEVKGLYANPVPVAEANQIMSKLAQAEESYRQRRDQYEQQSQGAPAAPSQAGAPAVISPVDQAEIDRITEQAQKAKALEVRRKINPQTDSIVRAAIKLGGLKPDSRGDITGESKGNKMLPGIGAMFSPNGTSIDELAARLGDAGYIPPAEMNNLGGVPWLSERLSDELAGRRTTYSMTSTKVAEQAIAEQEAVYTGQQSQLESGREAEYAQIAQEHGQEAADLARLHDEQIENTVDEREAEIDFYEQQLEARRETVESGFTDALTDAEGAARFDQLRQDDARASAESDQARRPQEAATAGAVEFSLNQQTEQDAARAADQEKARQKAAADEKSKADTDDARSGFVLAGSARPADEAAARGQESLFDSPRQSESAQPAASQEAVSASGDQESAGNALSAQVDGRESAQTFERFNDLGPEESVSLDQTLDDVEAIMGFRSPFDAQLRDNLADGVPMAFDLDERIVLVSSKEPMTRIEAAQYMAEEVLHGIDAVNANRTISASSKLLEQGGAIREEAQQAFDDGMLQDFLTYPLDRVAYETLSDDRVKAELFARLGVLYLGEPQLMREALPNAYSTYDSIFGLEKESPVSGDYVFRKVWRDSTSKRGQVRVEYRTGDQVRSDGARTDSQGRAGEGLARIRQAIGRSLQGSPLGVRANLKNMQTRPSAGFSVSSGSNIATIPLDRAQALVSAITSRLNNAPDVFVVQSMQDAQVPEAVRKEDAKQRSQGATGEPEGFYYQGKGYIVLDGITTGKDETVARAVARVFAHEVLGHAGLRGLFRGDLDTVLSEVAMKRLADVRLKAEEYGLDISNREDRLVAAEEVLAELAQTEPENSLVTKAIEAIRRALRRLLMKMPADVRQMLGGSKFIEWVNSMTDAEIIDRFIVPAREFIRGGDGASADAVPVFQRGEGGDSIAGMANNERGDRSSTMPTPERLTGKSEKLATTKIVNDQGKPLLVKHGSKSTFDEFKAKRGGIYFTTDGADAVAIFTEESRGDPTEHYLIAEKPFDARWKNMGEENKAELRAIIESVVDSEDIEAAAAKLDVDLDEADPFDVFTDGEFFWGYGRDLQNSVLEKIKSNGYDAVIFPDSLSLGEPHVSYVVFSPDQVVPANPNQPPRTDGADAPAFQRSNDADSMPAMENATDQTDTPAFKEWFGDSKVVDDQGRPLVVYHGTDKDISVFADPRKLGGIFFTPDREIAQKNADKAAARTGGNPVVYPVYLKIERPNRVGIQKDKTDANGESVESFDGHIGSDEMAVFEPAQIKSAIGNNGDFDASNPDIRFSRSNTVNFSLPDETLTGVVIRKMQDKFKVLKDLQANIIKAGGNVNENNNAYQAEERFHGQAENDIRKMQEEYVEPLAKKMAQFDISRDQLDEFLYARHAGERNARIAEINPDMPDGGSGMTNAEARAKLDEVRATGKQGQYEQLAAIVYDMLQMQRDMVREGGLESDLTIDAWEDGYQFYVPLKGWAEDTKQEGMPRTGKGFAISGRESKRAMGRSSQAASPVSFTINDLTEKLIRRRKNEVGNAFLKLVRANPNSDFWQVFTDDKPETQRSIKKVKDPESGEMVEQVSETAIPMAMLSDRYFTTKKNGKTFYIKINTDTQTGQHLMKAMKNIGPESNGAIIRTMAGVTRVLSALNTSYSPEFMISNFARDVQTALLNLQAEQSLPEGKAAGVKIAKQTMKDVPKAMKAIYGALRSTEGKTAEQKKWQELFEQFREDGAKTGWFDMKDLDGQSKSLDNLVAMAQGGFKGRAMLWAREAAQLVENLNQSVENAVRLSAYANAINAGISRKQASSLAKNLTVNFNRRGEIGTVLNAIYMFANASIQGTANFVRTMGTLKGEGGLKWSNLNNAQKIAVGMMSGAYFIGVANRMSAGEDEDDENWYDKVPDYVKERNIVIMKSMFGGDQDGTYWKIPLPYGYNVFYVIGNAIEAVTGGGKSVSESAADVALAGLGSFSPIGFQDSESGANMVLKNMAPTIIKPIVEVALNENFMGSSIYTENLPFGTPRPESALGRNSTPEAYRALSKWLNEVTGGTEYRPGGIDINPDVMQHFLDYFGGSAYAFFGSKVPDAVHRAAAGVVAEENRVPFLSRVSGRVLPYADNEKFYQRRDSINQLYDEYRAIPAGERSGFEEAELLKLRPMLRSTERRLSSLRKRRNEIYSADMSLRERDPQLKDIEAEMKVVIDRFNKAYNAIGQ